MNNIDMDRHHIADKDRLPETHRVNRDSHTTALAHLGNGDLARHIHLPQKPATEYIAVAIGVGGHGQHADGKFTFGGGGCIVNRLSHEEFLNHKISKQTIGQIVFNNDETKKPVRLCTGFPVFGIIRSLKQRCNPTRPSLRGTLRSRIRPIHGRCRTACSHRTVH